MIVAFAVHMLLEQRINHRIDDEELLLAHYGGR